MQQGICTEAVYRGYNYLTGTMKYIKICSGLTGQTTDARIMNMLHKLRQEARQAEHAQDDSTYRPVKAMRLICSDRRQACVAQGL